VRRLPRTFVSQNDRGAAELLERRKKKKVIRRGKPQPGGFSLERSLQSWEEVLAKKLGLGRGLAWKRRKHRREIIVTCAQGFQIRGDDAFGVGPVSIFASSQQGPATLCRQRAFYDDDVSVRFSKLVLFLFRFCDKETGRNRRKTFRRIQPHQGSVRGSRQQIIKDAVFSIRTTALFGKSEIEGDDVFEFERSVLVGRREIAEDEAFELSKPPAVGQSKRGRLHALQTRSETVSEAAQESFENHRGRQRQLAREPESFQNWQLRHVFASDAEGVENVIVIVDELCVQDRFQARPYVHSRDKDSISSGEVPFAEKVPSCDEQDHSHAVEFDCDARQPQRRKVGFGGRDRPRRRRKTAGEVSHRGGGVLSLSSRGP